MKAHLEPWKLILGREGSSGAMEVQPEAVEALVRDVEIQPGAVEAQNGAMEGPVAEENYPRALDALTRAVRAQYGVVEAHSGVVEE